MSLQIILWSSVSKLSCIGCSVAKLVLCLDPNKVAQKDCVETDLFTERVDFPYKTIEAELLDTAVQNDCCGGTPLYTYTIRYELEDLIDETPLVPKNIKGVFCRACLSTYIDEKAGDDVTLDLIPGIEDEPSTVILTNQHGCQYSFSLSGGAQGPQGVAGAQGSQGSQGVVGSQGAQGVAGLAGSQGAQGSQGSVGAQGAQGSVGAQGSQGSSGAQGSQGVGGSQGAQGSVGAQGTSGSQGPQGSVGAQGAQGFQGAQGDSGPGSAGDSGDVQFSDGAGGFSSDTAAFSYDFGSQILNLLSGAFGSLTIANPLDVPSGGTGGQVLESGIYTPVFTSVANIAATTNSSCNYIRVGSTVTVSGRVSVDPTLTATSTQLGISLPVASDFGNSSNCAGTGAAPGIAGMCAAILADTTNDRAQMQWVSTDITNQDWYFTFTYTVI